MKVGQHAMWVIGIVSVLLIFATAVTLTGLKIAISDVRYLKQNHLNGFNLESSIFTVAAESIRMSKHIACAVALYISLFVDYPVALMIRNWMIAYVTTMMGFSSAMQLWYRRRSMKPLIEAKATQAKIDCRKKANADCEEDNA